MTLFQLWYYVPAEALEQTKEAVFAAGAGRIGAYEHCCWQTLGEGQFRPLPGSDPYLGSSGCLEHVPEYRVELVCTEDHLKASVHALRRAHPYEEPAFGVVALAPVAY